MTSRANSRFNPYRSQRPTPRGTPHLDGNEGHARGTRNHLVTDGQPSAPQNVFFQQGSQAPIFNAAIVGDVNNYTSSAVDGE